MSPRLKLVLSIFRLCLVIILLAGLFNASNNFVSAATQIDIVGPPGSEWYGNNITVLPNGNLVVVDYGYDDESTLDVGAVYLYNGRSGELISMLTGSTAYDRIGNGGVTVLTNGNYVIRSPEWNLFFTADVGAITWASQTSGVDGVVSSSNSLIGSTLNDRIGSGGIHVLSNGNYLVLSPDYDFNVITNSGAVTWGNGTIGISGTLTAMNSLVGGTQEDLVGNEEVVELTNGNYVVPIRFWDHDGASNAGAVTWGNGNVGVTGVVSEVNSLVGSSTNDSVGGVVSLENGNYVVYSQNWDNGGIIDAGMVTLADGLVGKVGTITPANSLVGSTTSDRVGGEVIKLSNGNFVTRSRFWDSDSVVDAGAITWGEGTSGITGEVSETNSMVGSTTDDLFAGYVYALSNGNYVAMNPYWDNGLVSNAGAVTWGDGSEGTVGVISPVNSLVGSSENDNVGGITELKNGNYLVKSPKWDNGAILDAGAVTWGNGTNGISGIISNSNSLIGTTANDMTVLQVNTLTNGNYVVCNHQWNNGDIEDAGAVTWGNGLSGVSGEISSINSLVGTSSNDYVGLYCSTELANGNYVVNSFLWNNESEYEAGAATWGDGTSGISGEVSSLNSLVGTTTNDNVGKYGIVSLNNGNFIVLSSEWDNGPVENAGAVTWGNGTTGMSGIVSSTNSLVGSKADDLVGNNNVIPLSNGNYVVSSPNWDNSFIVNAGAVTWGNGTTGSSGVVSPSNSLVGSQPEDQVSNHGVVVLTNGNYVVISSDWDNGVEENAGAVTWGNGVTETSGMLSSANSLVGSATDDMIGNYGVTAFSAGDYGVLSPFWDNGGITNSGAVTWGEGTKGTFGPITTENSVLGTAVNGGPYLNLTFDAVDKKLVVGRRFDHIVTLFFFEDSEYIFLPIIKK
ncbi:MAG: hypothetical protein IH585_15475 [Anaerolineaceae bacterium]|nr:hypothetical protein [Anaerolineaceae bacterium]